MPVIKRNPKPLGARILVVDPPSGILFALQRGKGSKGRPVSAIKSNGRDLSFAFEINVVVTGGTVQLSGDFVQGKPGERFVYINSGTLAGEHSPWTRRAKITLESLSAATVERALATNGIVESRFQGTARDGGPSCATVPLVGNGWIVVNRSR